MKIKNKTGSFWKDDETKKLEELLHLSEEEKKQREKRIFRMLLFITLGFFILYLLLLLFEKKDGKVKEILRPDFGDEKEVNLIVSDENTEEMIQVTLYGKTPDLKKLNALFSETEEKVKETLLGENKSFSETRSSLNTDLKVYQGVQVFYQSLNPDVITDDGIILVSENSKVCPYSFQVTFIAEKYQSVFLIEGKILPEEVSFTEELMDTLISLEKDTRDNEVFILPDEFKERKITFKETKQSKKMLIFFLPVMIFLFLLSEKEKLRNEQKRRVREMNLTYPLIVRKISLYSQSGLSIRQIFCKISEEYQKKIKKEEKKKKKASKTNRNEAYENIVYCVQMLNQGMTENECLELLSERIHLPNYTKLMNILLQNVKQGTKDLHESLEREEKYALLERKNELLKRNAENQTKVLFPMALLFLVVVLTVILPAFLTF